VAEKYVIASDYQDAAILDRAAAILKRRSRKPKGFALDVAVRTLQKIAEDIRVGKL
jgi:hypothetical protein